MLPNPDPYPHNDRIKKKIFKNIAEETKVLNVGGRKLG